MNQLSHSDKDDKGSSQSEFAQARVADIAALFSEMHGVMKAWREDAGPATKATGQKILLKMSELQTVHLLLLRAEEVFHDKYNHDPATTGADYDAIRSDIGRALDRIRATLPASEVSETTESE